MSTTTTITPETLVQDRTASHSGTYVWRTIRLGELTRWGQPVVLDAGQLAELASGAEVLYSSDWDDLIRLPRTPRAPAVRPAPPTFTCPTCGEHRDTTLRGHCDDCD